MTLFHPVKREVFATAFTVARHASQNIHQATSAEVPPGRFYYLSDDLLSGFVVSGDGELTNLWSLVPGRGSDLVSEAVTMGADYLDCFDGYLPTLYARHGFVETSREANWTPGGPDVVYMTLGV